MNKVMKAVLICFLSIGLLTGQPGFAEEPMVIAGEVEAASLPDDYEGAMGLLEDLLSSVTETATPDTEGTEEPIAEPTIIPTAVPIPTEIPAEAESPYTVSFTLPSAWTNAARGTVTFQITDTAGIGVQRIEYHAGAEWNDVTLEYFASRDGKINTSVSENGTITVRMTDPHGHVFEESTEIRVFDRIVPTIRASIQGENLHVQAEDADSEVAGVQVNGLLFTEMDHGVLDIHIPSVLSKYDHLAVRAFDYAGNFSDPVSIDNPFYVDPTAVPQKTPSATHTASATETPLNPTAEPTYMPPATDIPVIAPEVTPQIIYVQPEATPTPVVETEYITIGPGMPYMADGNGHTLDVLYSAATNKQFITMQTKSGNVFYLVIDYDKPIDEEAEMYETYFLNLVDERDLMALMSEEEMPTATPQVIYVTPEPTAQPAPTSIPTAAPAEPETPSKQTNQMTGVLALVLLLGGGGAAFYFLKVKGKTNTSKASSSYDLDDDEDEDEDETDEENE